MPPNCCLEIRLIRSQGLIADRLLHVIVFCDVIVCKLSVGLCRRKYVQVELFKL